ncbi:hypothetical protein [Clostridium pasteurianum]|uniref:hypothetical protein n=1 Tax=Clostridium pasteurianum TaxID=1501 RepID=UPI0008261AC6|nr:hypothetical protein [Clostridium pasteurianum]PJI08951.1 hypothetical protein CUB90_14240 [Clostridium sp. CT7]
MFNSILYYTDKIIKNAIKLQKSTKPLILHSDLGCQYISYAVEEYIDNTKLEINSFSRKGGFSGNACIEFLCFFKRGGS